MREFNQTINEKYFNMLWRALSEKESEMAFSIEQNPDAEESALLGNELVYLRLCKNELEEKARKAYFSPSAFSIDDGFVDLSEL